MSRIRFLTPGRFLFQGAASCAVLLALMLGSAPAAVAEETVSVRVHIGDLDLARPEGVSTLLHRLSMAAKEACGPRPTPLALGQIRSYETCRTSAQADAVRQVGDANVTAAFEQRIGRPIMLASNR